MSLLVNYVFETKTYKDYGESSGSIGDVNPTIQGISVAFLQLTAALEALIAGRLGGMAGRKECVDIRGFICLLPAFIQIFAPGKLVACDLLFPVTRD